MDAGGPKKRKHYGNVREILYSEVNINKFEKEEEGIKPN